MAGDLYSLLMGSDQDAEASAAALAAAIRGNRATQMAGALGSPNAITAMGAAAGGQAAQDANLVEKGLTSRMHYGQAAQEAKNNALRMTLEARAREGEATRNALLTRAMIAAQGQRDRADATALGKLDKMAQTEYTALKKEWDPASQVRSAFGQAGQTDYANVRGLALALRANRDANGRINLNPLQQQELGATLGRMLMGGVPTEHTIEQFTPKGVKRDAASILGWLTSAPVNTDMTEWADQLVKTMEGESEAAQNYIRKTRLSNTERLRRYYEMAPESARRYLSNIGYDKPHPLGWIDPNTFETRDYDPNASAKVVAGGGGSTGPVKVNTPEEAMKLPPGTTFVTPDGRIKVR